ncbi:MAG TPA: phosphoribosyltransferase family protein [Chryseolinea sp.]|jgi:predicted phosphoribosyltransferase|nr:phosphoribosyltransferase family protein [Chryseolinea sp.]
MTLNHALSTRSRKEAGVLLAEKLGRHRNSNGIVVAVSKGAAEVGYYLASELRLPLEVVICKEITHPGDTKKTIGSISADVVLLNEGTYDIPQDYIYHQIVLGQSAMRHQQSFYNSNREALNLNGKTIILVIDVLRSSDSLKATLQTIWNRRPREIKIAVAVASPAALQDLSDQVNEIQVLAVDANAKLEQLYEDYVPLNDEEVRNLISTSLSQFNLG